MNLATIIGLAIIALATGAAIWSQRQRLHRIRLGRLQVDFHDSPKTTIETTAAE